MKGLIIKDIYSMKKYAKSSLITVGLMLVYSIFLKNTSFVSFMICFFSMSIVMTILGDDEVNHWDKYALCMPVDRRLMVREKYVMILLILMGTGLAACLVSGGMAAVLKLDVLSSLQMSYIAIGMVSLITAIVTPVCYKIGIQKARYVMIACALIPTVLLLLFFDMLEKSGVVIQEEQLPTLMRNINIAMPFVLLILMLISYSISLSIYRKKEW